jgi:hypothetical protein
MERTVALEQAHEPARVERLKRAAVRAHDQVVKAVRRILRSQLVSAARRPHPNSPSAGFVFLFESASHVSILNGKKECRLHEPFARL